MSDPNDGDARITAVIQARQAGGRQRVSGVEEGQSLSKAVRHAMNIDGLGEAQNAWRSHCKQ